jgi:type IV secretion system protein VirB9
MTSTSQYNVRAFTLFAIALGVFMMSAPRVLAEVEPKSDGGDPRIRVASYKTDEVYRLRGFVGFQIDLEFESGEAFVGLAAGDIEGLAFVAQDNHLFLKPKAATVGTNLTVLTTRRHYHVYYTALVRRPTANEADLVYALRFQYPPMNPLNSSTLAAQRVEDELERGASARARNVDYWYCGHEALRPIAASDDGVHTRLRFAVHAELPAIFVRNEDGGESLLNFSMEQGEMIVHRVARQFVLRRGSLAGCILNKGYLGSGERLESGTVAPHVQRERKAAVP